MWPHVSAETIGVWGINFFTVLEGLGLISQIAVIWRQRSGASFSVGTTLFLITLCGSSVIYGLSHHRPPVVYNGLTVGLGLTIISILLWRFKGYLRWERWFGFGLLLALAGMLITGHHDRWYCAFSMLSAGSLLLQPWEIHKNRSSGVVDIRMLMVFEISNIFWVLYGYTIRDWVLMLMSPIYTAVLGLTIVLWWIYRPRYFVPIIS